MVWISCASDEIIFDNFAVMTNCLQMTWTMCDRSLSGRLLWQWLGSDACDEAHFIPRLRVFFFFLFCSLVGIELTVSSFMSVTFDQIAMKSPKTYINDIHCCRASVFGESVACAIISYWKSNSSNYFRILCNFKNICLDEWEGSVHISVEPNFAVNQINEKTNANEMELTKITKKLIQTSNTNIFRFLWETISLNA